MTATRPPGNTRLPTRAIVVGGLLVDVPAGACAYCHAAAGRHGRAVALHCTGCDRHLGAHRLHFVARSARPGGDVLCGRCAERRRDSDGPYHAMTRATAALRTATGGNTA